MKKKPEEFGYKSGFWITRLLCVHLFTMFGILLSDSTVRRVLHRLDYVLEDPNFGQGQAGKIHLKLRKHSKRLKKQSKALLSGRNELPSSACAKENVDEDRAAS